MSEPGPALNRATLSEPVTAAVGGDLGGSRSSQPSASGTPVGMLFFCPLLAAVRLDISAAAGSTLLFPRKETAHLTWRALTHCFN